MGALNGSYPLGVIQILPLLARPIGPKFAAWTNDRLQGTAKVLRTAALSAAVDAASVSFVTGGSRRLLTESCQSACGPTCSFTGYSSSPRERPLHPEPVIRYLPPERRLRPQISTFMRCCSAGDRTAGFRLATSPRECLVLRRAKQTIATVCHQLSG